MGCPNVYRILFWLLKILKQLTAAKILFFLIENRTQISLNNPDVRCGNWQVAHKVLSTFDLLLMFTVRKIVILM